MTYSLENFKKFRCLVIFYGNETIDEASYEFGISAASIER